MGRQQEATRHFRQATSLKPELAEAHNNLGGGLQANGHFPEAARHFREAVRLKPDFAMALYNLAWLLATCPDQSIRDGQRALELAQRAAKLTNRQNPFVLEALAAAHADLNNFKEAVRWQEKAIELAPPQLKQILQGRLKLYRTGTPYRTPLGATGDQQ